ncbi:MAG TPA: hypothetical protein VGM43_12570 [Bryobacteraceae bacterium]
MFRKIHLLAVIALVAPFVHAATLQQLSMDQMTDLATSVVRARVTGVSAAISTASGTPTIYTHYQLQVSEVWKGSPLSEVAMPGGTVNGQHQQFPGVPELKVGSEYVLFLWKSPTSGTIQTLGLTQGIFDVSSQPDGSVVANRRQSGELMVDASGHRVTDRAVRMGVLQMRARVRRGPEAAR